jgi:hypothetical protein
MYWLYFVCICVGIYKGLNSKGSNLVEKDSKDFLEMLYLK